jgi:hypothetical protein
MNHFGNLIGYRILPGQISAPVATPPLTLNVARPVRVRINRELSGRVSVRSEDDTLSRCRAVELHLKTGRTPFDVNSVYLKAGQRFRVALKYRTDSA